MKNYKRLICLILVLICLYGCGSVDPSAGENGSETNISAPGKITVYSEQRYKAALLQVFSHINLTEKSFSVDWVENMEQADIVISNHVDQECYDDYRVIDVQQLSVKPMEQLMLRDDRGVIGIPVFLRLTGFWYDEWLYSSSDMKVPQSIETWKQCTQYPTVCEKNDTEALLWGVVAPMYLYFGGTAEELSSGNLQQEPLSYAMSYLREICQQDLLLLSDDARHQFTSTQASFWLASDQQIAASYNFMSNRSRLGYVTGLILPANEYSKCIVRADVLMVRKDTDAALADLFLQRFFQEHTLIALSSDTQLSLACRVQYGASMIPELAQMCYKVLSSPSVEIEYVSCSWSKSVEDALVGEIQALMDEISAEDQGETSES